MAVANSLQYYLFVLIFCCITTLRLINGGEALRSLQRSSTRPASPTTSSWRMMPSYYNASGSSNSDVITSNLITYILHFAVCKSIPAEYYGASAVFSVHPLREVHGGQETSAGIWMGNMQDIVEAGWHVRPAMYGDNQVHFYVTWTADNYGRTGCFNLQCPGFVVREGSSLVPGSILASVTHLKISIRKDSLPSGDWRLLVNGAEVGRWPNTLFSGLSSHASFVSFGGRAEFVRGADVGPPMGSGNFPGGGDVSSSASIKNLQNLDYSRGSFVDFKLGQLAVTADARECYDAIMMPAAGGVNFFYGGPSGCKNYN